MSETVSSSAATSTKQTGISGSTLKIIALISMFIDHLAAVALEEKAFSVPLTSTTDLATLCETNGQYMIPYLIMRLIGRLAFPLFCFLLVEGFTYTKDIKKYALRLLIFAFISEIPFDLALHNTPFYWSYQNVFFTLFIGLVVITFMDLAKKMFEGIFRIIVESAVLICGILLAEVLLVTDYGALGVLTIVFMYMFKRYKNNMLAMGVGTLWLSMTNTLEISSLLDIIFVKFYNGKRGLNLKYVFYAFYPVHLLLLYFIFKFGR